MRRACKFRIYPAAGQAARAVMCLRDHQRLYNGALEERREAWRMRKASVRYGQQPAQLKDIRGLDPDQGRWSFSSQQATLRRLDKAMAAFYRRAKAGDKRAGYPRFKALDRWDSVEWPCDGDGCRWKPEASRVYFQGVGHVKVRQHRGVQGRVKTVTLKREGRRWTSGAEAVAQQALARKQRGSANRRRAKVKVAEVHRRIRDRRADFHHKTARALVNACDVIALEDLRIASMTRSASGTPEQPGTNVAEAGRRIVLADPRNTSITCHQCGQRCLRPWQALVICPVHGGMDADVNAARNIYARARLGSGQADAA